jgi:hypothetical protein
LGAGLIAKAKKKVKMTYDFAERSPASPPVGQFHAKLQLAATSPAPAGNCRSPSGAAMAARWSVHPRKALCVAGFAFPIVAVFAFGLFLLASLFAWYHGTPIDDGSNVTLGGVCVLIAGLFLIVFHVKHETIALPCKRQEAFLATCRLLLRDLGYEVQHKPSGELVSRPSFRALLMGGRIHVDAAGADARITGPKVFVEILRRRLRLHSYISNAEQSMRDSRTRQGDRLLKRVHISLRVMPQQWNQVGDSLLKKLTAEGAEVYCEVHLMAQSDEGLRESFVEGPLREWLKQENIPAELRKDHVRWELPLGNTHLLTSSEETQVDMPGCAQN